jgi:hypothetical protein
MRVLVCGGRDFADRNFLCDTLDLLREKRRISFVIASAAKGADTLAAEWAEIRRIKCQVFHADRVRLGRHAGPIRNQRMFDEGRPELIVAFPGGCRTEDIVQRARKARVEIIEPTRHAKHLQWARFTIGRIWQPLSAHVARMSA